MGQSGIKQEPSRESAASSQDKSAAESARGTAGQSGKWEPNSDESSVASQDRSALERATSIDTAGQSGIKKQEPKSDKSIFLMVWSHRHLLHSSRSMIATGLIYEIPSFPTVPGS